MHYYQFNIGDYKSHTEHLEPLEDLAYRRMIDWCYLHEKQLPLSIDEIARLIRMRTHTECITYVLETYFECTAIGYQNNRISKEVAKYNEKCDKAKKSAEARWKNKAAKDNGLDDANALQTNSEGNAKQDTLNKKHKPVPKYSDDSIEVARHLESKIKSEFETAKTNPESWAIDIDRAIRLDNRTKEQLIGCIDWIYQPAGSFWRPNIMSGKKLREKYDTLFAQCNSRNKQQETSYADGDIFE